MVGTHSAANGLAPWNHVGVYVGHNEVVHFAHGQVQRVNLDKFIRFKTYVYRVIYQNEVYPSQTIVKRALDALQPNGYPDTFYSLLSNNSKHFAGFVSVNERGMFRVRHLHIG